MTKATNQKYISAVGRRKNAVAIVRLTKGGGDFIVNQKKSDQVLFNKPFDIVGEVGKYSASIKVQGGGKTSQNDAILLGLARVLVKINPELKPSLKKAGFLKRDPREKERKKPGLKKARKAPQWSKR